MTLTVPVPAYEIPVDEARELVENALACAAGAPSGANRQPWHFVVITDQARKRELRLAAEAEEREFYGRRASGE